ncbi:MAG TPA: glutamate-1-semialdehyde 2,1-aminomutase [Phototrophicaceae bacterium]|nr:glutamate-1-semialdehyde 2,1-aminomutase [Phototrophicaceae bacterium]
MIFDKSKTLFERACRIIPGGVNSPVRFFQPYPFFVDSGNGSRIFTKEGNTLIDYCMGYGAVFLGHSNQEIALEVKNQIDKGSLFCIPTEKEIELAELCNKIIPSAEMVRITNTGAEATMHAIRLARAYTRKTKIIKFDGGYHGAFDYVLNKAGSGASELEHTDGILDESVRKTITIPYNNIGALESAIKRDQESGDSDIACLIIEPVMANSGLILPEKDYLNQIRKITKQNNIVLIFDEVVTGFRLALGGASEFFGIKSDITTFAKALGNGHPISLIAGKKEIMSQLAPSGKVYQASTFAGNPISVTASLKTLSILSENKDIIYPQVGKTCDRLVNGIKDVAHDKEIELTVNSIGSMFQAFFTKRPVNSYNDVKTSSITKFSELFKGLLDNGTFIPPSQFETCFISTSHNEEDIEKTIESFENALTRVKEI